MAGLVGVINSLPILTTIKYKECCNISVTKKILTEEKECEEGDRYDAVNVDEVTEGQVTDEPAASARRQRQRCSHYPVEHFIC